MLLVSATSPLQTTAQGTFQSRVIRQVWLSAVLSVCIIKTSCVPALTAGRASRPHWCLFDTASLPPHPQPRCAPTAAASQSAQRERVRTGPGARVRPWEEADAWVPSPWKLPWRAPWKAPAVAPAAPVPVLGLAVSAWRPGEPCATPGPSSVSNAVRFLKKWRLLRV